MAAAIKEKRGRVSVTTNAVLLEEAAAREIRRTGIDMVAVSVAGARAETNDSLRMGSRFDRICTNISHLCGLKPRPHVHLVMQMMKPNLEELSELVTLAARLGVDKVIAPNLDYTPTNEVDTLKAFDRTPDPHYIELKEEAKRRGRELGVKVYVYPLHPRDDVLMCDADPVHNVWISVSGEVAPCPYLALSFRDELPRLFWGKREHLHRFSFGKVTSGLDQVLNGKAARSFREAFSRRLLADRLGAVADEVPSLLSPRSTLAGFLKPLAQTTSLRKAPTLLLPPDLCRNCYKFYGL
jgi:MoaA/NifB/PqqE/SkfB family radical SAM enzyme